MGEQFPLPYWGKNESRQISNFDEPDGIGSSKIVDTFTALVPIQVNHALTNR